MAKMAKMAQIWLFQTDFSVTQKVVFVTDLNRDQIYRPKRMPNFVMHTQQPILSIPTYKFNSPKIVKCYALSY